MTSRVAAAIASIIAKPRTSEKRSRFIPGGIGAIRAVLDLDIRRAEAGANIR